MRRFGLVLVSLIMLLAAVRWAGAQFQPVDMPDHESGMQRIQYTKSGEILYNMRWTTDKVVQGGRTLINYKLDGDNNKTGKERIDWKEDGQWEVLPAGIRSLYWLKKSTGAENMTWNMKYDWKAHKAYFSFLDADSGKKEQKTIELKGNSWTGDTINWQVRGFPFEKGPGASINGQVVFPDGLVMDGSIVLIGEEKLDTPFGKLDTYKLELKPTSAWLGLVAPTMYLWCTKAEPHLWLRYDGRDEGPTKPRTKNFLMQYEPRTLIK